LKTLILNSSDNFGGAGRAAYRIHDSLARLDIYSEMWVNLKVTDDPSVLCLNDTVSKFSKLVKPHLVKYITKNVFHSDELLSLGLFTSSWPKLINSSNFDIVNLHWVNGEMLSINDVAKIEKPIVWTLHDMWAFSGAEHYSSQNHWKDGYTNEKFYNLNKLIWNKKFNNWNKKFQIVTPSTWLANCVKDSRLFRNWEVEVIPNPIDTEKWNLIDKETARNILGLSLDKKVILFCAFGDVNDPRKGLDLLIKSLSILDSTSNNLVLLVVGSKQIDIKFKNIEIRYLGVLNDDISLKIVYNSVDILAIPSRLDNLPNVALEGQACGVPVISYNVGGFSDLVKHDFDGYLSSPFDVEEFAYGIQLIIDNNFKHSTFSYNCRTKVVNEFSPSLVGSQYKNIFEKYLN
jgi:glycosyltransferase involved in cell wall biosynthesis